MTPAITPHAPVSVWAVADGRAGLENQVLGLAEAMGRLHPVRISVKRLRIREPWDRLPVSVWGDPQRRLRPDADSVAPPMPDVVLACGRRAIGFAGMFRAGGAFLVQTQAPRTDLASFDLVIPPTHDGLSGDNVFAIVGAPNRLSAERLATDSARLRPLLGDLPLPYAAVLIGGDSKDFRLDAAALRDIVRILRAAQDTGQTLLVTTSRRTRPGVAATLRAALDPKQLFFWDGTPLTGLSNPYFGMLGLAERVFVTTESANMLTDAAFTGRPVHVLPLRGGAPKWDRLHARLTELRITQPGAPVDAQWTYAPLRETDRAAREIWRRLVAARG